MTAAAFHILLVEDEPVIGELVRNWLNDDSVTVTCASTGPEGLQRAHAEPLPQLILLDVVLPGLDGISVCRLLKADPRTRAIPLYMLTGKARKADVDTALRAGADGYIAKPFRGADLSALIERLRGAG